MSDKNYIEINEWLSPLESCVERLLELNAIGLYKFNFNGHWLYSDTVTIDSAYKEVLGKTKVEFEESQTKWREDLEKRKEEHKATIPILTEKWIEEGHKFLSEDRWEEWNSCVPIRLADLYEGMELGMCLDIIKVLKTGDFKKAREVMENQGHSGMSFGVMKSMLISFSDVGEEFIKTLDQNDTCCIKGNKEKRKLW